MKRFSVLLLALLIAVSCFVFTGCQSTCEKRGWHEFYPEDTCRICKKTRCETGDHDWVDGRCINCWTSRCDTGDHRWDYERCMYCGIICCDIGEHEYTMGKCEYCGETSCEDGAHYYRDGSCVWCDKTPCQAEGHDWHRGFCIKCERMNVFSFFFPDISGDTVQDGSSAGDSSSGNQSGNQLGNQSGGNFWDAVGDGLMLLAFMLVITIIASALYWLGCALSLGFITWFGHAIMVIMTFGIFLTYHWAWGVVMFVVFCGAYFGIVCPLVGKHYFDYDRPIF